MKLINNYDDYAESISQDNINGTNRAHKYIEKPAMYSVLPDLNGRRVLCVGCGTGEECGYISDHGGEVVGIDISEKSINIAQEHFPKIQFEVMDMHDLTVPDEHFDLVYSSLSLHYTEHFSKVLGNIYNALKHGGELVFSTLHPVKWSAEINRDSDDESKKSFKLGYDSFTKPSHVYGDYLSTRSIIQKPADYPVIEYWNRPISAYLRDIKEAGFELVDFIEPSPIPELKTIDRDYWEVQSRIPQFMIFILRK